MPRVAAIVRPGAGLEEAVARQERAPDTVGEPYEGADWVWLLDGTATPRHGALAALLDAAERLRPREPRLLASRIVDPDGELAGAHVPIAPQDQTAVAIETVGARVLHVRAVTGASLLLRPRDARGAPAGPAATKAWTAALLRGAAGAGFLVPASVADARSPEPTPRQRAELARRLLLTGVLAPRERLRFAAELAERALAGRR